MTARVELELSGPLDHLRIIWQAGEALLESVPFREDPEGTRYNTLLSVQEMLTNILRHAHELDEELPIRVQLEADASGFRVSLMDRGPYFDPRSYEFSMPDPDSFPADPGGFGIMIATMVMDSIDYRRDGEWNVLGMAKLVGTPAPAGAHPEA